MNCAPDRLYRLLPGLYRDRPESEALRSLLAVISEQVDVIEDDIERLYDNWFIETCEDWAVPYIGDLIGFRPVNEAGAAGAVDTAEGRLRNNILIRRQELANTLGFRRRKGTVALLETLAEAVTGWPALAVEFYRRLAWTQHVNHLRLHRARTLDLRDGSALDLLDGPFDRTAHTVDVRRMNSRLEPGRYNIPSVGVFVWRLRSHSHKRTPALCLESIGSQCFTFSILGNDAPLYTAALRNAEPPHVTDETNVPVPIRRRALEDVPPTPRRPAKTPPQPAAYYGENKSIAIYASDWPKKGVEQLIPCEKIVSADLSDWHYRAKNNEVALDPVLGRIAFPITQRPGRVRVTYHHGFSADIGGGEYDRSVSQPKEAIPYTVTQNNQKKGKQKKNANGGTPEESAPIAAAIRQWRKALEAIGPKPDDPKKKKEWEEKWEGLRAAVIEIADNEVYSEPLAIDLNEGESLQIRAAVGNRPVIRLLDYAADGSDALTISGKKGSRFKLDGLLVTGRGIIIRGPERDSDQPGPRQPRQDDLCDVTIRHCTLVPGWGLEQNCDPKRPNDASVEIIDSRVTLKVAHSIIGSVYVSGNELDNDPVDILISDSIVDATRTELVAIGRPQPEQRRLAFARLSIVRSTVIGEVAVHAFRLAENSIFVGLLRVARRQVGCMRFSYVQRGCRTPRRYHCQPDAAIAAVDEIEAKPGHPPLDKEALKDLVRHRVRPRFNSLRYGTPTYCQLALDCPEEIARGADDESEMGVFHDLFQPQRTANLRARIDEYTTAGMEAGIVFAN